MAILAGSVLSEGPHRLGRASTAQAGTARFKSSPVPSWRPEGRILSTHFMPTEMVNPSARLRHPANRIMNCREALPSMNPLKYLQVVRISIRNFRGIRHLDLNLDETTVLIGENNSGKTSVLDALRLCLSDFGSGRRTAFDPLDFHLPDESSEPQEADPIQIEITFAERDSGSWHSSLIGEFSRLGILQIDDDRRNHIILQITCEFNSPTREFVQQWRFLNLEREELPRLPDRTLSRLKQKVLYFHLPALRAAKKHFGEYGPFWKPFLKGTQLPPDEQSKIEQQLTNLNRLIVASNSSFENACQGLEELQKIIRISSENIVSVEAISGKISEVIAKAQLHIKTSTDARIPVDRHGEGVQSIAVLMLFSVFLNLEEDKSTIIGMEEPEAHLHPSATRALWQVVENLPGQKIISTHSGDLLAEIEISQIRRLADTSTGVQCYQVSKALLSPEEERKFKHYIRQERGSLLFARCWLLVEGESESWVFRAAAKALDLDMHREGVEVVEYRNTSVGMLIKVADALGIAWYCVADNDHQGKNTRESIEQNQRDKDTEDRCVLPYKNLEHHLISEGYRDVYQQFILKQNLDMIKERRGTPEYLSAFARALPSKKKTQAAFAAAAEMIERRAEGVSTVIRRILERTFALAGGAKQW